MKKFSSILIVLFMCILFIAPLSNLPTVAAQKFIEGKNLSSKIFALNPSISNISITGVTTSNIKESGVTEYYSKPSSIQKSLSTKTITINTAAGTTWAKVFGGTNDDIATNVQQTSDGGYIIGGTTKSFGAGKIDALIIKLGQDGSLSWAKTFGGTNDDIATNVQQTSDGGYIIGGYTTSYGAGNSDFLVIKLGNDGSLSWSKTFGGTNDDWATSIRQTSDGGYIIGGTTYSFMKGTEKDILLLKLDLNGSLPNANCNDLIVLTNLSVKLINPSVSSASLNIKAISPSLDTPKILANFQNIQFETICEGSISPFPPKDLKAILSGNSIVLSWAPSPQGTYSIGGYAIYRGTSSGMENSMPISTVDSLTLKFTDTNINLTSNITYFYYVRAFDDQSPSHYSDPSNEVSINIVSKTTVIILQINNSMMTVNGKPYEIDPGRGTKPIIKNDRTLVPIRAIVEALGGTITWVPVNNGIAVTIKLGSVVINLQTEKPTATVNGKIVYIDSDNHKIVPEIINNRTMLPIRFIAERLGAKVNWDSNTQTITITYKS